MMQPENVDDATLEYAARLIEDRDILDLRGAMGRRKRDREDADLRLRTRVELKAELARFLRAMKCRNDLDIANVLARVVAENDRGRASVHLIDAWPLAWKGLLNIYATVRCNSNAIPPETSYRIDLTEKGRRLLDESKTDPGTDVVVERVE